MPCGYATLHVRADTRHCMTCGYATLHDVRIRDTEYMQTRYVTCTCCYATLPVCADSDAARMCGYATLRVRADTRRCMYVRTRAAACTCGYATLPYERIRGATSRGRMRALHVTSIRDPTCMCGYAARHVHADTHAVRAYGYGPRHVQTRDTTHTIIRI